MRDDRFRSVLEREVPQPDPMLDEQRPGALRIGVTILGAAAIVALVLYGLSRPGGQPQTANTPEASQTSSGTATASQTEAPQAQPTAGNAGGAAQPSTTGQGQSNGQSLQGQGKSPRSDSATTGQGSAPSDKAAQPKK
jgi:hypothetical protein